MPNRALHFLTQVLKGGEVPCMSQVVKRACPVRIPVLALGEGQLKYGSIGVE